MVTFGYDDATQTLFFTRDGERFREITPYPDKEGALEWAQMLADIDNGVAEPDAETV